MPVNHYDCLKVTPDAPTEVIRAAYRALAGKLHPDRQGGTMGRDDDLHDQMAALNTAYEVLVDPTQRADYDASLIAQATGVADDAGHGSEHADEAPERDHGFSETRVDMDWLTPKVLGPASSWPPTGRRLYMVVAGLVLLVLFTAWVTWQVLIRHQMERALSDQYSTNPPRSMNAIEPDEAMMPTPELRTPSLEAAASKQTPQDETQPAMSEQHQPTVDELSRMSDEQLLAVLPTLGEPGSFVAGVPRKSVGIHHPLDGKPLNLRTDKSLVDPLAEEAAQPKSAH